MSLFFDFDVGPSGRRFRRAVDEDRVDVESFWKPEETRTLFSVEDIGSVIELSVLSICLIDADKSVTGFLALGDHPPLPGVDPAQWELWVRNMFQKYYLSFNTLFIHFTCCMDSVSEFFLEEAIISVFMNDFYLQHIILVVPPNCDIDCMAKYPIFKRRTVFKHCTNYHDELDQCISLFVAVRQDFCPKLKVRRAVEEDNDDIVEMLDSKCKKLIEMYGNFYISELLARHPESKRTIIVAEQLDKVVGVMCLNPDVNYLALQHTHELAPYHGLVQMSYRDRDQIRRSNKLLRTFGDPIMCGKWSPFDKIQAEKVCHSSNLEDISSKEQITSKEEKVSKIHFYRHHLPHRRSELQFNRTSDESETYTEPARFLADRSLLYLLDDEPLDYKIVNIDTHNLIRPQKFELFTSRSSYMRFKDSSVGSTLKKRKSSLFDINKKELLFKGEPNSFSIELFGLHDDIDDRRAFDLLEAAFESMPNYDYCIIRIPCSQKAFALLQHFCFVPTKPKYCGEYALYVAHRNSVLGRFRVRKAEFADIPQIAMLFHNVEGKEAIWTVEHSIIYHKTHLAYVILCGTSIIGIGILDPPDHLDLLRTKFVIDRYQRQRYHVTRHGANSGVAMLKTVLIYPAFEPHFSFFAREMLRYSGSSSLIWLTAYRNKLVAHKANGLVTAMTPLPYRVTGDSGLVPELQHVHELSKNLLSFSAWFLSRKMTSISRLNVDTRIVVVGASKAALSFLNSLLFGDSSTYLTFTSVTLVSPHGLPYLRHFLPAAEVMFSRSQQTSERFLKSTPFLYYVNVVHATMVEINRQDKYIITDHGSKLNYDMLLLLHGKQYQHPDYFKPLKEKESLIKQSSIPQYIRMDNPDHRRAQVEPPTEYFTPENVFIINTLADASNALNCTKSYFWQFEDYKICVYGSSIEAYCCISGLLQTGVNPEAIVFVEPFPPEGESKPRVPVFCNYKVDETIREVLNSLKITTHRGYYFSSWCCDDYDLVTTVEFISYYDVLKVDCCAFFYYGKKDINPHAFIAINKCGLAYDGGILIDHQFRTNDPAVYAAGSSTRYFRRYHAQDNIQKFYSSLEIGKRLGEQIRNQLDPLFPKSSTENCTQVERDSGTIGTPFYSFRQSDNSTYAWSEEAYKLKVPNFVKPKVWYCLLPGDLQYLEVRPPGSKEPHYYIQSLEYNGYVMETYMSGYFKLHLNKQNIVNGITCLTPASYSIENFKMLYGLSAVVLNNVHLRYNAGKIKDFYDFFRAPWSGFLYTDRSEELLTIVKHLKPKNRREDGTMEEILQDLVEDPILVTDDIEAKMRVRSHFEKAQYFEAIADYVMEWLTDNDVIYPMYITPCHITEYAHDFTCLPQFKRSKKAFNKMLAMVLK